MRSYLLVAMTVLLGLAVTTRSLADEHNKLEGQRIALMVAEGFQDAEALVPMAYLINRGAEVTVIGIEPSVVKAYNSDLTMVIEKSVEDVCADDFDGLVLPGGRGPARLREHTPAVEFTQEIHESGKIIGAICHGPQVLVTAGLLDGRRATCFAGMRQELIDAGAEYEDVSMVRDENIITSRLPKDLADFSAALVEALAEN